MTRLPIPIFGVLAVIATLFPVIAGLSRIRRLDKKIKPLVYLFIFNAISSLGQLALASFGINNFWTVHVYLLIELPLIFYVYMSWSDSQRAKTIFLAISVVYVLMWAASKISLESLMEPSPYLTPISRLILTVASVYMLYCVSRDLEVSLLHEPRFWFSATTIIVMAGSVMFTALQGIIIRQPADVIIKIYHVYWAFYIIVEIFYSWTFLCRSSLQNSGGHLVSEA